MFVYSADFTERVKFICDSLNFLQMFRNLEAGKEKKPEAVRIYVAFDWTAPPRGRSAQEVLLRFRTP